MASSDDCLPTISWPVAADWLSRRRFLKGLLASGVGACGLSAAAPAGAGAAPNPGTDTVLVVLNLGGGNDGLNMLVPTGDGAYYDRRGGLAITPSAALDVGGGWGLHPSLPKLWRRWRDAGVAAVVGVGDTAGALSHFQAGTSWACGSADGRPALTGWLGRWLDDQPLRSPFEALTLSPQVGLELRGQHRSATSLGVDAAHAFLVDDQDRGTQHFSSAVGALGTAPTGLGELADAWGAQATAYVAQLPVVRGLVGRPLAAGLAGPLTLAARIINARLGTRVISYGYLNAAFDTHVDQAPRQSALLGAVDDAIAAFYAALDPVHASRVAILTVSEFGRRVTTNNGEGTDHGTASTLLLVSPSVNPGVQGEAPPLRNLDSDGNLKVTTDFRNVYATIIDRWLGGDGSGVVGRSYADLRLFA